MSHGTYSPDPPRSTYSTDGWACLESDPTFSPASKAKSIDPFRMQRSSELTSRPDGWLGGSGRLMMGTPTKKWHKPTPQESPVSPALEGSRRGGYDSPCSVSRPGQIQIEGIKSIKDNAFFKNFKNL